jgi:hypothetical protein
MFTITLWKATDKMRPSTENGKEVKFVKQAINKLGIADEHSIRKLAISLGAEFNDDHGDSTRFWLLQLRREGQIESVSATADMGHVCALMANHLNQ